jgi:hypothetical protein
MRAALFVFALSGCFDSSGPVDTRACNDSEYDFASFEYRDPGDRGPLASGECTPYERVDTAYDYTLVRFTLEQDTRTFESIPIDFVGEDPRPGGEWSYRVTVLDLETLQIGVQAVED